MVQQYLLSSIGIILIFVGQSNGFLGFGTGKPSVILDFEHKNGKIAVNQICPAIRTKEVRQITRIETIQWLHENLVALEQNAESEDQIQCLHDYREPLGKLNGIIKSNKLDACNSEHISLVEAFHNTYIEPQLMEYKLNDGQSIAEPLKWFFIYYATNLSRICRQNFLNNLQLIGERSDVEFSSMLSDLSGRFIRGIQALIRSPDSIEKDEDFLLFWSMKDRYERVKGLRAEMFESNEGDQTRVRLKMKSHAGLEQIQAKCRNHLKPIYQETALSSMKLIDMGYKIHADSESPTVDKRFQNWYSIVQACEYLLPVKFYEDSRLGPEEMVIISKEEADLLAEVGEQPVNSADRVSFIKKPAASVDNFALKSNAEQNPSKLWKEIKSNLKSRIKSFKKMFLKSLRKLVTKEHLKKVLISRRSEDGNKFVSSSAEPVVRKVLKHEETEGDSAAIGEERGVLERHIRAASTGRRPWFREWLRNQFDRNPMSTCLIIFCVVVVLIAFIACLAG